MGEFLQGYGVLIFFGLLFLLMLFSFIRGRGMGCCSGSHQHNRQTVDRDDGTSSQNGGCH